MASHQPLEDKGKSCRCILEPGYLAWDAIIRIPCVTETFFHLPELGLAHSIVKARNKLPAISGCSTTTCHQNHNIILFFFFFSLQGTVKIDVILIGNSGLQVLFRVKVSFHTKLDLSASSLCYFVFESGYIYTVK